MCLFRALVLIVRRLCFPRTFPTAQTDYPKTASKSKEVGKRCRTIRTAMMQ